MYIYTLFKSLSVYHYFSAILDTIQKSTTRRKVEYMYRKKLQLNQRHLALFIFFLFTSETIISSKYEQRVA